MPKRPNTKFLGGLWYRREADCVLIGIDPSLLTDGNQVALVDVACAVDDDVEEHEPVALVEMTRGREFEIEAPCAGRVVAIRPGLPDAVAEINADPLGQWFLKIKKRAS